MTSQKTYNIGKVKQLVDLNGDSVNFIAEFKITSKNNQPFEVLVIDQTTLDNDPNVEYKKVLDGAISGKIVHDKNIYQNYFLILKADKPCECFVEITKQELPKTEPPQQERKLLSIEDNKDSSSGFNWGKTVLIVVIFVGVGYLVYSFMKKKDTPSTKKAPKFNYKSPSVSEMEFSFSKSKSPSPANPLLDRFKKLEL